MKDRFYVYMYVNPQTKKPFYVGKGVGSRAWSYTGHNHNKWVTSKINKLQKEGYTCDDFVIIMEKNLTEDEAFKKEELLINQYGKKMNGGILFNVNDGGKQPPNRKGTTFKMPKQAIEKIKKSWTYERRQKMSNYSKNYVRNKDWCSRISESKRKYTFDKELFEHYVINNVKLKDILSLMNTTYDIIRDRMLSTYKTVKFRDIRRQLVSSISSSSSSSSSTEAAVSSPSL